MTNYSSCEEKLTSSECLYCRASAFMRLQSPGIRYLQRPAIERHETCVDDNTVGTYRGHLLLYGTCPQDLLANGSDRAWAQRFLEQNSPS